MAGKWNYLKNKPSFNASTMLLLTDGSVMCQEAGGKKWWRLVPDASGSYLNGSWLALATMHQTRLYFASAVLADGRVFVAGGEFSDAGGDTNTGEIYDPTTDVWTVLSAPTGWSKIGDAPCCVLASGKLLLGSIDTKHTAIFDPSNDTWASGPDKDDASAEETWSLLGDGSVLTAECGSHPRSERYVPSENKWVSAGNVSADLVQSGSIEIGPAVLLPSGTLFAIGATGHTDTYKLGATAMAAGTWTAGPDFTRDANNNLMEAKDAPACLLPNGRVLCCAGPNSDSAPATYPSPTQFFEYDGLSLTEIANPTNAAGPPYVGRLLLLPSGEALFAAGTTTVAVYEPDGGPQPSWKPRITNFPAKVEAGQTYFLQGTQLNGLSQAVSYGDDCSCATNYPIVRFRNRVTGHVFFGRTHGHSTMGVSTGSTVQSTSVTVPMLEGGPTEVTVIANGIASDASIVEGIPAIEEDWIDVNYEQVVAQFVAGRWKVVDGKTSLLDFGPHTDQAQRAAAVIKQYRMDRQCFVGRPITSPNELMMYFTVGGAAPQGPFPGEDAIPFDPTKLVAQREGNDWVVTDGSSSILDFGSNLANALNAIGIIEKYGFMYQCFVGRPDAPMMYFRK